MKLVKFLESLWGKIFWEITLLYILGWLFFSRLYRRFTEKRLKGLYYIPLQKDFDSLIYCLKNWVSLTSKRHFLFRLLLGPYMIWEKGNADLPDLTIIGAEMIRKMKGVEGVCLIFLVGLGDLRRVKMLCLFRQGFYWGFLDRINIYFTQRTKRKDLVLALLRNSFKAPLGYIIIDTDLRIKEIGRW